MFRYVQYHLNECKDFKYTILLNSDLYIKMKVSLCHFSWDKAFNSFLELKNNNKRISDNRKNVTILLREYIYKWFTTKLMTNNTNGISMEIRINGEKLDKVDSLK